MRIVVEDNRDRIAGCIAGDKSDISEDTWGFLGVEAEIGLREDKKGREPLLEGLNWYTVRLRYDIH